MPWEVRSSVIQWIFDHVPRGRAIVELGSGDGTTKALCHDYELHSVEHNAKWVHRYPTRYIHARLVNGWYDPKPLKDKLPSEYDLLIIDGPPCNDRRNIIKFFDLFRQDVPIILDDIERNGEIEILDFLRGIGYVTLHEDRTEKTKQWIVMRKP